MDIQRTKYLTEIRRFYDSNLIKVLTGIRRCGKSVLLDQIKKELSHDCGVAGDHIVSINFEDLTFSNIRSCEKLNAYVLGKIKDEKKYYIFLDEVQHVRSFEKALASLKAMQNVSIFVTGSNSTLLSGKLASLLVGRCKEFKIMPFSYREFLEYFEVNNLEVPEKPLQNYLRYGGMPQRMDYSLEKDIKDYLLSIYEGIIEKDICTPSSKINKENFRTIADYVISNVSKEFSADNVVEYFNKNNHEKIYRETVYRYLNKLEEAFLISRVKRYDVASKRTLKSIEKQYAMDNGLILACNSSNKVFISHALENLVYNELIYRGYDVRIGKTYKGEINFVAMRGEQKCFIQVAYLLADEEAAHREFSAFDCLKDPAPKYVFSLDDFDMSKGAVKHLNIEDWLRGKVDIHIQ